MRVAVTGARGRLGRAMMDALLTSGTQALPLSRPAYDIDDPPSEVDLLRELQPDVVVHCAAWTDVDGCARRPELAHKRNAVATERLATACAISKVDLILISTNEVFDGNEDAGHAYDASDRPAPVNPYGRSKLAAEVAARTAFRSLGFQRARLAVVRTAWLFGEPGNDFPERIALAAIRARSLGESLLLVQDEVGSPSYGRDVAASICEMLRTAWSDGTYHCVNAEGGVTREQWGRSVLRSLSIDVPITPVNAKSFARASTPPLRSPLRPIMPPGCGIERGWAAALADYSDALRARVDKIISSPSDT